MENNSCKHDWDIKPTVRGNRDHVHNFGHGKQYLYKCKLCGKRQYRDFHKSKNKEKKIIHNWKIN